MIAKSVRSRLGDLLLATKSRCSLQDLMRILKVVLTVALSLNQLLNCVGSSGLPVVLSSPLPNSTDNDTSCQAAC